MELASLENGWMTCTISRGLDVFQLHDVGDVGAQRPGCWWNPSGQFRRPPGRPDRRARTFTNLSPMLTSETPLRASTACSAWMASVLVSGVCVLEDNLRLRQRAAQQGAVHQLGINIQHLAQLHAFKINRSRLQSFLPGCAAKSEEAE